VRPSIQPLDPKDLSLVAKVSASKEGEGILGVRPHASILPRSEPRPKAVDISGADNVCPEGGERMVVAEVQIKKRVPTATLGRGR